MRKACLALVVSTALLAPVPVVAEVVGLSNNAGVWRTQEPEMYRLGFVAALAQYVQHFLPGPNTAPYDAFPLGYQKCLANQTATSLLKVVDSYLDRNAFENTYSSDLAVADALRNMCMTYLPSPK